LCFLQQGYNFLRSKIFEISLSAGWNPKLHVAAETVEKGII